MAELNPPLWAQDADYDAIVVRRLTRALTAGRSDTPGAVGAGEVLGAADLAVAAAGGLNVTVAAGDAFIHGSAAGKPGSFHVVNDAAKLLTVAGGGAAPRVDLVVARVVNAEIVPGSPTAWSLAVIQGPAGGADPVLSTAQGADNYVVLAKIAVAAGAGAITQANITDVRRRAAAPGGIVTCTSTTRPAAPAAGTMIYETDTGLVLVYTGAAWVVVTGTKAWATWVPVLTGMTLANGSIAAGYQQIGKTLHLRLRITVGPNSTFTGPVSVSLPPGIVGAAQPQMVPARTDENYPAAMSLLAGAAEFRLLVTAAANNASLTPVSNTRPLANGITYYANGTIEVA